MKLSQINNIGSRQLNKLVESRFGFKINFDSMSLEKAYRLATGITESLNQFKKTHGAHSAEKHPKYMEMFLVRESLHRWMAENKTRLLKESEMGKSEAILAAKNVVDTFQDLVEKIGKLQNEQLPALVDSIRDQIGGEQAEQYKSQIGQIVSGLVDQLNQAREGADTAARQLTGEQVGTDMGIAGAAPEMGAAPSMVPNAGEMGAAGADDFAATDAAAGGTADLGREPRQ